MNAALVFVLSLARRFVSSVGNCYVRAGGADLASKIRDPRGFPFLQAIINTIPGATGWEMASYDASDFTDEYGNFDSHLAMRVLGTKTLAWINKGLTTVDIFVNHRCKAWDGTIGPFRFAMSSKIGKRLSCLTWQHQFALLGVRMELVAPDKSKPSDPDGKVIYVCFTRDTDVEADGISYIRPGFWHRSVNGLKISDRDKAKLHAATDLNGRIVTQWGLIKGNFTVAKKNSNLNADIHTSAYWNLKKELWAIDGKAYVIMYPEVTHGFGEVKLDRQSFTHFYGWLFTGAYLLKWQEAWVNKQKQFLVDGTMPPGLTKPYTVKDEDEEVGNISTFTERFTKYAEAGLSTKASLAMFLSVAKGIQLTVDPPSRRQTAQGERRQDAPKWQVEGGQYLLLRSEKDCEMTGRECPPLAPGELYIHPDGWLVVPSVDYKRVKNILGGADKDDHVFVHVRIDIETGEYLYIVVRCPIGVAWDKDGNRCSEYWFGKAVNGQELCEAHYGDELPPPIDMSRAPKMIPTTPDGDIDESQFDMTQVFVPEGVPGIEKRTFSRDFVLELMSGAARAAKAYGRHANLMLFAIRYDISLTHRGFEEVFVDTCQQSFALGDVLRIEQINFEHTIEILTALAERATLVDGRDLDRVYNTFLWAIKKAKKELKLTLMLPLSDDVGLASSFWEIHETFMADLRKTVVEEADAILASWRSVPHSVTFKYPNDSRPWLLGAVNAGINKFQKDYASQGLDPKLKGPDYEAIGDQIADYIWNNYSTIPNRIPLMFAEARSFVAHKSAPNKREPNHPDFGKIYSRTDIGLLGGRLLDFYIAYLTAQG